MTDAVTVVIQPEPQVHVTEQPLRVEVGIPGLQGPPGPPGDYLRHVQTTPEAEWVINHHLGRRPVVAAHGPGGLAMLAEVLHVSDTQVRIYFDAPTTGYAILT